jgi:hypothetical protein
MHALFAFLALALGATDVYRWTDAAGQIHYSDQPQPGAERLTITVSRPAGGPPATDDSGSEATDGEESSSFVSYQSLTITSPAQDQVLWNIEGQLDVEAAVQPALQPDHVMRFYLDGRMAMAEPGTARARFSEVFRGEHSLRVEVLDGAGSTLVSSPTSRFFVRQTVLPNPVPAARP